VLLISPGFNPRAFFHVSFDFLKNSAIVAVYYQAGDGLIDNDNEAAFDGVHPTDLGMMWMEDFLLPQISRILQMKTP
jgi:hypothetical protein